MSRPLNEHEGCCLLIGETGLKSLTEAVSSAAGITRV